MSQHLFTNVNVLDCTGKEPFAGEVRVKGNEITAIARDGEALDRDGSEVHDGEGRMTLMPGLVESHAHLSIDNTDDLAALGRMPPEEHTLLTMHNARLYLDTASPVASAPPRPSRGSTWSSATPLKRAKSPGRDCSRPHPG